MDLIAIRLGMGTNKKCRPPISSPIFDWTEGSTSLLVFLSPADHENPGIR